MHSEHGGTNGMVPMVDYTAAAAAAAVATAAAVAAVVVASKQG
jgi:hypothetical protein